ncbi:lipoate--protein ligase family protein [Bacillaceae bacterium W0354]
MENKLLQLKNIRLIDDSDFTDTNILESFALDDALCLSVSETNETFIHFWVHKPTVVFGIPDSRLPYFDEGVRFIRNEGYDGIIRNSGGLAVLLDEGILNMSLVFPHVNDIHAGYEAMLDFIKAVFKKETTGIKAYEITESYCPGSYDLSIDGKKFAGISQRRVKNGSAVQIYLCVEGDGQKRAETVKHFYDIAKKSEETKFSYPNINPQVMASLEQLLNKKMTVDDVIKLVKDTLNEHNINMSEHRLNDQERNWFNERLKLMKDRNKSVKRL